MNAWAGRLDRSCASACRLPLNSAQPLMRKVYRGKDIEVSFDLDQCVHIGECLHRTEALTYPP